MHTRCSYVRALALLLGLCIVASGAARAEPRIWRDGRPVELLVDESRIALLTPEGHRFADVAPGLSIDDLQAAHPDAFVSPVFIDDQMRAIVPTRDLILAFEQGVNDAEARRLIRDAGAGEVVASAFGSLPGVYLLRSNATDGDEALRVADSLATLPGVRYCEPDMLREARKQFTPNDEFFPSSWGLRNTQASGIDVGATRAWDTTTGHPDVVIAVLDDGVQLDHPDLLVLDGRDFTDQPNELAPGAPNVECDTHGTRVAGVIGSRIDNFIGTAGVAPHCSVVAARVAVSTDPPCSTSVFVQDSWIVNALEWADEIGARITNTSLSLADAPVIADAFAATRERGIIHFASAGNSGGATVSAPARYPGVHAVGSIIQSGGLASSSNHGPDLDFVAPGVGIISTDISGQPGISTTDYAQSSGTSFASPFAAGACALLCSTFRYADVESIEAVLMETTRDLGAAGRDDTFGWGLVKADRALAGVPRRADAYFVGLNETAGGEDGSAALAIAPDAGIIAGELNDPLARPFRRSPSGRNLPLTDGPGATARGTALDASSAPSSVVVGVVERSGIRRAALWDATGITELGVLNDMDFGTSRANAVSADGEVVVGIASVAFGIDRAFRWTSLEGMQTVGTPARGASFSEAHDVSHNGDVIVGATDTPDSRRAFRWTQADGLTLLDEPPGGASVTLALATNCDGSVIVGDASTPGGTVAMRWSEHAGAQPLGDLPGGDVSATATAVSADGRTVVGVGDAGGSTPAQAFVWTEEHGMRSVDDVLAELGVDTSGWTLLAAWDISADGGTIVGEGLDPLGRRSAWLARLPMGPGPFDLVIPSPGAPGVPRSPFFQWQPAEEAESYRLIVDDDPALTSPEIDRVTTLTSISITGDPLQPSRVYYWNVIASSSGGETPGADAPRPFSTAGPAPGAFVLVSPPPMSIVDTPTPLLLWSSATHAASYTVEVALDSGFSSPLFSEVVPASAEPTLSLHLPAGTLLDGAEHHWRVLATNAVDETASTPQTSLFTVQLSDACDADVDGSGAVDLADVAYVVDRIQSGDPDADANADGSVNVLDLTFVIFRVGECSAE